jgi:hypothetical protein
MSVIVGFWANSAPSPKQPAQLHVWLCMLRGSECVDARVETQCLLRIRSTARRGASDFHASSCDCGSAVVGEVGHGAIVAVVAPRQTATSISVPCPRIGMSAYEGRNHMRSCCRRYSQNPAKPTRLMVTASLCR